MDPTLAARSFALAQEGAAQDTLLGFGVALAIGALIGVERERKKLASEFGTGGLRTFVLLAQAGALTAWLAGQLDSLLPFALGGLCVTVFLIAGYVMEVRARPDSIGLTTEIAGLLTFLLGATVLFGHAALAVPLAIATAAVLAFKQPLHGLVERLGREDLEATLKLLVASFVVLPVLPNRAIDPWGVFNPYETWLLVILISALSLAGYAATRLLGPRRGLLVTGLAGGLVSSTAITLGFARQSRDRAAQASGAMAAGLLLAWAVMFARVAVAVAVVYRPLLAPLAVPLGAMGVATLAAAIFHYVSARHSSRAVPVVNLKNPFRLTASIRFALLFTAIMFTVELVQRRLPASGIYAVAALAGLTDVDAITLSLAREARGGGDASVAAGAIATAALANTLVKCGLVATLGTPALRRRVVLATAVIVASGALAFLLA